MEACFAGLLAWVLRHWQGPALPIAVDATTLGQRFVVLTISVVYAGTAIPVAWKILKADAKGSWKAPWLRLLRQFKGIVPPKMKVIVLADRGLYAQWLFQAIVELGWHPFLRINAKSGEFRPRDAADDVPLKQLLHQPGDHYGQAGTLFRSKRAQLDCTLLGCWSAPCAEPWIIATDLPADQAQAAWYGLRSWIERGFKHDKTGGMHWHNTRMTDPARATVLWLAMAVARFLSLLGGTHYHAAARPAPPATPAEANPAKPVESVKSAESVKPAEPAESVKSADAAKSSPRRHPLMTGKKPRSILSIFAIGLLCCRLMLLTNQMPPATHLSPEAWPDAPPAHLRPPTSMPP